VKDSSADAAQKASNAIKEIHRKTEGVIKDIKDGGHEIKQDIHKTAKNISNEVKNLQR